MSLSRRNFLATAAAGAAFGGYARLAHAQDPATETYRNEVHGYGPLKPDPFGLFDLPEGFSYRVVSQAGETMSDGLLTPHKADGMGCFAAGGSRVILVRNHELKHTDRNYGPLGVARQLETEAGDAKGLRLPGLGRSGPARLDPALAYDLDPDGLPLPGGCTILHYDTAAKRLVGQHQVLTGTAVNCAGGVTPWGSWLTCEETLISPRQGVGKAHGYVFEVPSRARGVVRAEPLKAMGRFQHEAAAVDPVSGAVYMTEDNWDNQGLFYRFLPNVKGELARGGRLQALAFRDGGESRNYDAQAWKPGDWREVAWIDLDDVESPEGDLHLRGHAKGAAWFARGEGIHFGNGELYFTCTSGGAAKGGQVMRYVPSRFEGQPGEASEPGRIQLFVEAHDQQVLNYGDNLTVTPWGHLVICEDRYSKDLKNHLRGVTPEGKVYTLGRNMFRDNAELAGVCFSPDGSTMFVNIYWPGITLAITGPWSEFRA